MKIVFFGTPPFAAHILESLLQNQVEVEAVVTRQDKPKGRGKILQPPAVKELVQRIAPEIPIYQPKRCSHPDFASQIEAFEADLFVVAAYGEILKEHVLKAPKYGCINVHASILPYYRGAAPIQRAIVNGEVEGGVSIMQLVLEMDAGDVYKIVKTPITPNMTAGELENEYQKLGAEALLEVLHKISSGEIQAIPQNHSQATFAPKISLEECKISWNKPAATVHNLIRGTAPKPGAWCEISVRGETKRLKVLKSEILIDFHASPGTIDSKSSSALVVACADGAVRLLEIQLEGKKAMKDEEFLRGVPLEDVSFNQVTC